MNLGSSGFSEYSAVEVDRLLAGFERDELTSAEVERLNALMLNNPAARRRFIRGLGLIASLEWGRDTDLSPSTVVPTEQVRPSTPSVGSQKIVRRIAYSFAAGLAVCAFVMLITYQPPKEAEPISQPVAERASAAYVARIIKASADCRWGELMTPIEFLVRVRSGDRMHITTGIVELEFYSGARIILHGPTVFTPTGVATGHLESGRLTGRVDDGNFRLVTPAAEVIDLGTEFGVVADAEVGSDVLVFDGRVRVVSRLDGDSKGKSLEMTEGMAARFRFDGTTEYGLQTDAAQFTRSAASSGAPAKENEICLIDVLAGGDGLGVRLAGAIDPLTGRKDYGEGQQRQIGPRATNDAFHPCTWNPMIDGVFIPSLDGRQVQIDSAGGKVDLPASVGMTWSCVWARCKQSVLDPAHTIEYFWGGCRFRDGIERLEQSRNGLIGIHASVGITFDLQAVRLVHRRSPIELRGIVTNLDDSNARENTADLRIFVDGEPHYSRLGFCRDDGDAEFSVPLAPKDRFLTIVSGDDGDYSWDQVVLIDPVIVLPKLSSDPMQGDR